MRSHAYKVGWKSITHLLINRVWVPPGYISDHKGIVKIELTVNFSVINSIKYLYKLGVLIKILPNTSLQIKVISLSIKNNFLLTIN